MLLKSWFRYGLSFMAIVALLLSVATLSACSDSDSAASASKNEDDDDSSDKDKPGSSSGSAEASGAYVMITEIMYNAPEKSPLEWVELKIMGGSPMKHMDQYELRLEGAISFMFPDEPLDTNEYIVVTNDPALFHEKYPDFKGRLFGPWDVDLKTDSLGKLSNEGDVIDVKLQGDGDVSCAFSKDPPWPSLADGKGRSLVFVSGNPTQASSWAASKKEWGSPGAADEYVSSTKVRLNEIQPFGTSEAGWVELYNAGSEDVNVAGWIFESKYKNSSWTIAGKNTVVPAKGYLVLPANDSTIWGEVLYLNANGGAYYLYETSAGKKTGTESSLLLAASKLSSGIVDVSDGSTAQGALAKATSGAANAALKVGPIFIDEIYYHPPTTGSVPFEFMELVNKGDTDVMLYVVKGVGIGKGWKVEGVNMEFPQGATLPAKGRILLLSDSLVNDTAAIRKEYEVAKDVQIFLYKGKLSNRGETIAVKEPFGYVENMDATIQWYYDWSDATLYSDTWEGFEETDGFGKGMQRVDYKTMGYEASAWKVAEPTVGK